MTLARLACSALVLALASTAAFAEELPAPLSPAPGAVASTKKKSEAPAPALRAAERLRVGIDGSVTVGRIGYFGAALRTEIKVKPERYVILRASYLNGAPLDGDGGGFSGGGGGVGYRAYDNAVYAGLEASYAVLHQRTYDFDGEVHKGKWQTLPQLTGNVGTKLGPFDLGLRLSGPIFTVGLSLGIDFTSSSLTPDPAARSRATQEKARKLRPMAL
jgi:hypothetical protein